MENITPLVLQKGKEVRDREPRQKRRTPITQKDILAYKKDIDALGLTQRAVCEYCGNENIADKDVWICFYCESVNYSAILALRSQDAELMNIVTRMNGFVSEGNYGEAINEHKKLFDKYNDPFYMHSFGMLYMQSSNHEIRMIRYDRKGFMEENAVHKKNAIDNMSEAKHIFSRTSTMCEKEFSMGNINALLLYTYFMTNIKLRRLKTADRAIKMLSEEGSTFLVNYSKMVLEAELGNPNGVLDSAAKLTGKDATINAYYYRAWALFRLKQYNYAKSIIESLTKYLANESTDALTMDIERALSII